MGVKNFKIVGAEETQTLGEIKKSTFNMQVNNKKYKVYPDVASVVKSKLCSGQNKVEEFLERNNSMKFAHKVSLAEFYDHYLN